MIRTLASRAVAILERRRAIGGLGLLVVCCAAAQAEDWNQFRGPRGDGVARVENVPVRWSAEENIHWKVALPSPCNGSPIVSKNIIFLAGAEDSKGLQRSLYAHDLLSGQKLWGRTVNIAVEEPTHKTNPYCGTTPAADGKHVVVWHSSAGLFCYDYRGNEEWSHDFGDFIHMWGYGTSPIIHDGMVYLHTGPGKKEVGFIAIRLADGEIQWKQTEPFEGDGEHNLAKKYMGSWATPVVTKYEGRDIVLCTFSTRVNAYDAKSGKIVFSCEGIRGPKGDLAYSSPLVIGDICVSRGGFGGPSLGFRMGGKANITESHRLWRNEKNPQSIGSGVAWNGHYFMANAGPGTIQCMDPRTGAEKWTDRGAGNHWASLVMAGGNLYATAQNGTVVVFRADVEKFDEVAQNKIGEPSNSTPAFIDGAIIFRSAKHLFCIGNPVRVAARIENVTR
ncbi:MAG TPA: hypothetical protein EYG57_17470 [Planctomycetes bacterium]|nr:hypothetical protein [Planctomycetaceae bacterium]HIM31320.1 hypothetical protein [Planctomycetota bacterium]